MLILTPCVSKTWQIWERTGKGKNEESQCLPDNSFSCIQVQDVEATGKFWKCLILSAVTSFLKRSYSECSELRKLLVGLYFNSNSNLRYFHHSSDWSTWCYNVQNTEERIQASQQGYKWCSLHERFSYVKLQTLVPEICQQCLTLVVSQKLLTKMK